MILNMRLSSRNKELFKNTFLFAISNFASKMLVFLMIPLYTSVLSTSDYGVVDIISTSVLLLLPIFTLTISEAVLRFCLSNSHQSKEYFLIGLYITFLGNVVVVVLVIFLKCLFPFDDVFFFIPVIFLLQSFSRLFGRFARGIDRVRVVAVAGVLETLTIVVCNLYFLLILRIGIWGYLMSMVVGYCVSCVYLIVNCDIYRYFTIKSINKSQWIESCQYSVPLIPNHLCWWLIDSSSKYILTYFVGFASVGIYTAAFRFPTVLNIISGFFIDAWLLSVIKEYDKPDSKDYIRTVYGYFSFVIMLLTLVIICLSKEIAYVFLKGEFYEGWIYIPIMCITAGVGGLFAFFTTIFSSEKKTYLNMISTITGAVLVILLSFILVPRYDIMGIVIATLVGYIAIWAICYYLTDNIIHWNLPWRKKTIEILIVIISIASVMSNNVGLSYLSLFVFIIINTNKVKGILSLMKSK